jgi:hypothetical protein
MDSELLKYLKDLYGQARAELSSDDEKIQAIKEREELMNKMAKDRTWAKYTKDYPELHKLYGKGFTEFEKEQNRIKDLKNQRLYEKILGLNGPNYMTKESVDKQLSQLGDIVNERIKNPEKPPHLGILDYPKYNKGAKEVLSSGLTTEALDKDITKSTTPEDFFEKLKTLISDNKDVTLNHEPRLDSMSLRAAYSPEKNDILYGKYTPISDKSVILHEKLHADAMKRPRTTNDNIMNNYSPSEKTDDESKGSRYEQSAAHFMTGDIPETEVLRYLKQDLANKGKIGSTKAEEDRMKELSYYNPPESNSNNYLDEMLQYLKGK